MTTTPIPKPTFTQADVDRVLEEHPGLTRWGLRALSHAQKPIDEQEAARRSLRESERVSAVVDWISTHLRATKTVREGYSSYAYKHMVEQHLGRYVTNGEFILAALLCGLHAKPTEEGSPNAYFNLDQRVSRRARETARQASGSQHYRV